MPTPAGSDRKFKKATAVSKPLLVRTTLTAKEMERLDRLRRRCDWLKRRIANHRGDPGFDKAELSALDCTYRVLANGAGNPDYIIDEIAGVLYRR
jgi:hypothetical protein